MTDNFSLALDAHNSKTKSLPNDPTVRGASATFFSFAGTNCANDTCTGAFGQEFTFNNGLPIMARTFFPTMADAVANTNGTVNPISPRAQLGSQMLRIWSSNRSTEVKEARLDGELELRQWSIPVRRRHAHDRNESQERLR